MLNVKFMFIFEFFVGFEVDFFIYISPNLLRDKSLNIYVSKNLSGFVFVHKQHIHNWKPSVVLFLFPK